MTKRLDLGGMKAFVVFLAFSAIAHAAVPPDVTVTFQTSSSMGSGPSTSSGSPTAAVSQTTTAAATTSSASLDQAAVLSSLEAYLSSDKIADSSRDAENSSWRAQANRTLASSTPASASTALSNTSVPTWDASDPRLVPTVEENWLETDSGREGPHPMLAYGSYEQETRGARNASGMGEIQWFLHDIFGENQYLCGVSPPVCGCNFYPGLAIERLRQKYPNDFYKAREKYFALLAINEVYRALCRTHEGFYKAALQTHLLSGSFAETFFPHSNKAFIRHCEARQQMVDLGVDITIMIGLAVLFAVVGAYIGPALTALEANAGGIGVALRQGGKGLMKLDGAPWKKVMQAAKMKPPKDMTNTVQAMEKSAFNGFLPKGAAMKSLKFLGKQATSTGLSKWVVELSGQKFHDRQIKDHACGLANVADRKFEDMEVIDTMLLKELKVWAAFIEHGAEAMGNGTGMGNEGAYTNDQTSELATQLIEKCFDAKSYQALHLASLRLDDTVNLMNEKLNARFIQTAWSDQHCSLQCEPNPHPDRWCEYREGDSSNPGSDHPELWCPSTKDGFTDICQAVCWQPSTDAGNVLLYGLNKTAGRPWYLNNTDIFEASWNAYRLDSQGSYDLVSDAQVTAWTQYDSVANTTVTRTEPLPLLAVSWSEFISIRDPKLGHGQKKKHEIGKWTACNVGDRWGSDSKGFWNATHWDEMQDKNYLAFRCRHNLQEAMDSSGGIHKHPGIYLVTSLRLFAYVLWPGDDVKDEDKNLPQALKILDYADSERERLHKAGFSEEATEHEIAKVLCDKHGQYWMPLPSEDTSHDDEHEGSHETLDLVHENCPKWNKENL
ncbi:hypothetical protein LTR15_012670 [Elasticomyces elasticus]|nr:hypothetical protein LTR15_012670 [Elasticomyces elasticus]